MCKVEAGAVLARTPRQTRGALKWRLLEGAPSQLRLLATRHAFAGSITTRSFICLRAALGNIAQPVRARNSNYLLPLPGE